MSVSESKNYADSLSFIFNDTATTEIYTLSLHDALPIFAEAVGLIAHPSVRRRGTAVGSVAFADPSAELPTALLAADGEVVARSSRGERTIAADDFFTGPFA